MNRRLSWGDRLIAVFDQGLRTLAAAPAPARPSPASDAVEPRLSRGERRRSEALMRVNHAGEVAAQALYTGQALLARTASTRRRLDTAAAEERDHLAWCETRLAELGGRKSALAPFWYAGSVCIGAAAAAFGDSTSLGFVSETEKQVEAHIKDHLQKLPAADSKSRSILERMAQDEAHHGTTARAAGGADLPAPVRRTMRVGGEVLRRTAYFL
ncbi:MAG: 2-polyprenyl-3-methyl-6-methoxy-1,4-benzoquinone monooxygenase [Gammaproteobacteria bacterium]|nr:2-polyprenyl-3-methyl-6-methoxy-1,4-benzoquinone monooxygenase [Gammaproteobacteria bacterium]